MALNRPQNKQIVDPSTNRLALEWDSYFSRLETQIAAVEAAIPTVPSIGSILLTSGTVTPGATLDIVLTSYTAYRGLKFVLESFIPSTDDVELWMRLSTDGGATYDATGYSQTSTGSRDNFGTVLVGNATAANQIAVTKSPTGGEAISNVAAEAGAHCEVTLYDQTVSGQWPRIFYTSTWFGATVPDTFQQSGAASRETSQDTDAVRFLFESGNIASGKYAVYGLN